MGRVISFSIPPSNKEGIEEVNKLKQYSQKTGVNFSYLVVKAIAKMNKENNL